MATVVSLLAKQQSGPAIAGQLLFYPVTNADCESGSETGFSMDPKKAITERTRAAARDLYGARHAERLRPVGYMQIETKEAWKQLGCGAVNFLIAFAVVLILARVYSRTHSRPGWSGHYCKMLASAGLELGSADPC